MNLIILQNTNDSDIADWDKVFTSYKVGNIYHVAHYRKSLSSPCIQRLYLKNQRLLDTIRTENQTTCCLEETYLRFINTYIWKVDEQKRIYYASTNRRNLGC